MNFKFQYELLFDESLYKPIKLLLFVRLLVKKRVFCFYFILNRLHL